MAREEKRFELRPVDDHHAPEEVPVVRLGSDATLQRVKPVRLRVSPEPAIASKRMELPGREVSVSRTHQPGIEALLQTETANPEFPERDSSKHHTYQRAIGWRRFALIGLILAGGVIWSLAGIKDAEIKPDPIRATAESILGDEVKNELEASKLSDRIETTIRSYFKATSVESLARLIRDPERVRPLMEQYYEGKPVSTNRVVRIKPLQPLTPNNRANFWMTTVELADQPNRNLVIEILETGEPRIDWETLVCYQPMKWDSFVADRPVGSSFDFRIQLEQDSFFSHEFADSALWHCFRLSAPGGKETLFGYAKANGETARTLLDLLNQNQGRKTSAILRVTIPESLQSKRGVIIEKLLSPRWFYINPPEA